MKKEIEILDSAEHKVSGALSIPKNASLVVVMSHGLTSNRNTRLFLELEKEFNSEGIGTLRYEYYGHGSAYGHKTRAVSSDITITKAAESLRAVVKYIRQKGNYDVGLLGSSFGGLVSLVVASKDKKIKFLALRSPVTNPIKFWNERIRGPKNKILEKWEKDDIFHYKRGGEDYILKWGFWKDMQGYDAFNLAKGISCPTFVVHGNKDRIVPIKYSKAFAKITGIKLNVINGADHHYSKPKHYLEMKKLIKHFILNEVKGGLK